ncbi:putative receptor activity-modifying protein 1 [Scophthalmus maximus]|uniref:Putative receptor activity-modifying protein 1 n=1 Tax=Scophthalmus maximus TaxID=52904 RepID=A0A2U9C8E2_SCOMX|nr:putative receptor activity-modifying protein 1 [Scophthalmus maximus]
MMRQQLLNSCQPGLLRRLCMNIQVGKWTAASQCVSVLGCEPHYENAIEKYCLAKFRLDMQELDQRHWCSWEDTVE